MTLERKIELIESSLKEEVRKERIGSPTAESIIKTLRDLESYPRTGLIMADILSSPWYFFKEFMLSYDITNNTFTSFSYNDSILMMLYSVLEANKSIMVSEIVPESQNDYLLSIKRSELRAQFDIVSVISAVTTYYRIADAICHYINKKIAAHALPDDAVKIYREAINRYIELYKREVYIIHPSYEKLEKIFEAKKKNNNYISFNKYYETIVGVEYQHTVKYLNDALDLVPSELLDGEKENKDFADIRGTNIIHFNTVLCNSYVHDIDGDILSKNLALFNARDNHKDKIIFALDSDLIEDSELIPSMIVTDKDSIRQIVVYHAKDLLHNRTMNLLLSNSVRQLNPLSYADLKDCEYTGFFKL